MFHFYTPWKRQKTRNFLTISGGYRNGALVWNRLKLLKLNSLFEKVLKLKQKKADLSHFNIFCQNFRSSLQEVFCKKKCSYTFRKIYRKNTCARVSFLTDSLFYMFQQAPGTILVDEKNGLNSLDHKILFLSKNRMYWNQNHQNISFMKNQCCGMTEAPSFKSSKERSVIMVFYSNFGK